MAMPWFQRIMERSSSKDIAKERLKLVLLHDRNDMSPELMERIRDDIVNVLSQYVEIDYTSMDIELTRMSQLDEGMSAFIANIPIRSVKNNTQRARW